MRNLKLHHVPRRHFTPEQRMILERHWNDNAGRGRDTRLSLRAFAREHGLPYQTMRRELLRGMAGKPLRDRIRREWFYPEYSAADAQADAMDKAAEKGTGRRFTNKHAEALRHHILTLGKSPAHARRDMIREGHKNVPSVSSIYYHIGHGDIGIFHGQTPYRPTGGRKRRTPLLKARTGLGNRSIEQRPAQADERAEFGHWEMDSVVSCLGGSGGLLILTERQTRLIRAEKLRAISANCVQNALRRLIRSGHLKDARSITTDNGCEFIGSNAIESLFRNTNKDLRVYHTHAYAAWEKGSVENVNRHVRRFFPKGTDFRRVSRRQIASMQDFINSIPRTTLNGDSAHEAFLSAS